jgi:hypothetical protein
MNTYVTTIEHLSKELSVTLAEATGFIKTMEACGMAKKVGTLPAPEGLKKKGKRAAVYEVQKNVEIFTMTDVDFNPLKEKKVKAEKTEVETPVIENAESKEVETPELTGSTEELQVPETKEDLEDVEDSEVI